MSDASPGIEEMWRCPRSRSPLLREESRLVCSDAECRLSFKIQDGIPVMLVDSATELTPDQWNDVVTRHQR